MWTPSADRMRGARLTEFIRFVRARGVELPEGDYPGLLRWSIDDLDGFWEALAAFFDVRFEAPPRVTLGRREMPGADWFVGSRLSYPEHVFRPQRGDLTELNVREEEPTPNRT
jgi:acetoacetyl-CoA synthetase